MSDVVLVSERRRSWPDEVKLQILAEAELPGENVCRVARRHDIDPAQVYQWRKKFRAEDPPPMSLMPDEVMAELPVSASPPSVPLPSPEPPEPRLEIALKNGRHLFAPLDIDEKRLGRLVSTLEKA